MPLAPRGLRNLQDSQHSYPLAREHGAEAPPLTGLDVPSSLPPLPFRERGVGG